MSALSLPMSALCSRPKTLLKPFLRSSFSLSAFGIIRALRAVFVRLMDMLNLKVYSPMCLNPITIKRPSENGRFWRDCIKQRLDNDWTISYQVPCGKCIECLHRQNMSRVPQLVRAMEQGPVTFVTLTYRNDSLPLAWSIRNVDMDTGELSDQNMLIHLPSELREDMCKCAKVQLNGAIKPFSYFDTDMSQLWTFTPSLRREDVRLYIKRKRRDFQRENRPMDFKYTAVGEYGPRTKRPHYHLLVVGLTESECREFFSDWISDFGNVCIKPVQRYGYSKKGKKVKDGYIAVAKYLSKYMSKGKFETDLVADGFVEKPRTMTSVAFGTNLTDAEKAFYAPCTEFDDSGFVKYDTRYDLVRNEQTGEFRLLPKYFIRCLPSSRDCSLVADSRQTYQLSGTRFPLPRSWKRRLYYYRVKELKKLPCSNETCYRYVYKPSPLQKSVSALLRAKFSDFSEQQFDLLKSQSSQESFDKVLEFTFASEESSADGRRLALEEEYRQFFATSIF